MIASETASRHQPMNWRDSIEASDIGHAGGVPDAFNAALSSPMKENTFSTSLVKRRKHLLL